MLIWLLQKPWSENKATNGVGRLSFDQKKPQEWRKADYDFATDLLKNQLVVKKIIQRKDRREKEEITFKSFRPSEAWRDKYLSIFSSLKDKWHFDKAPNPNVVENIQNDQTFYTKEQHRKKLSLQCQEITDA